MDRAPSWHSYKASAWHQGEESCSLIPSRAQGLYGMPRLLTKLLRAMPGLRPQHQCPLALWIFAESID